MDHAANSVTVRRGFLALLGVLMAFNGFLEHVWPITVLGITSLAFCFLAPGKWLTRRDRTAKQTCLYLGITYLTMGVIELALLFIRQRRSAFDGGTALVLLTVGVFWLNRYRHSPEPEVTTLGIGIERRNHV